jgi:hypothetical protein
VNERDDESYKRGVQMALDQGYDDAESHDLACWYAQGRVDGRADLAAATRAARLGVVERVRAALLSTIDDDGPLRAAAVYGVCEAIEGENEGDKL